MRMDDRLLNKMSGLLSSLKQEIRLVDAQGDCLIPRENVSFYLPSGMKPGELRESKGYLFMRLDLPDAPTLLCQAGEKADDLLRLASAALVALCRLHPGASDTTGAWRRLLTEDMSEEERNLLATEHNLPLDRPRCVMLMRLHSMRENADEVLSPLLPLEEGDVLVPLDTTTVALIKALDGVKELGEAKEFALAVQETVREESSLNLSCGIGDAVTAQEGLRQSYLQAQRAMEIGPQYMPEDSVFVWRDMLLPRFLSEIPEERAQYYHSLVFNKKTSRLLSDEMLETIDMFLQKDLNLSDTARHLYIHRNTLVYRLDKVQRMAGLDVRKFSDAFLFKLLFDLKYNIKNKGKRP